MAFGTRRLLAMYRCVYVVLTGVLVTTCLLGGGLLLHAGTPVLAVLALSPLGLLGVAVRRRVLELRAFRAIPGPAPSFFLGNLGPLLGHEHGARDQALLALHRAHGPIVRLHMAWGSAPFVSLSKVSDTLRRRDVDSNRRADATVLGKSLMGLTLGKRHQVHRRELATSFTPSAVTAAGERLAAVSRLYLDAWEGGGTRHGSLKADLLRWSAHSMGVFLCGKTWDVNEDLGEYLGAIATLEEAISLRAFHPFFVRWILPRQSARTAAAYRRLQRTFTALMWRRRLGCLAAADVLGKLERLDGKWQRSERIEEMISLVAGGTDAMCATMAQALVLLSRHPEIQAQARAQAVAAPDRTVPALIHDILAETLRLYPPVPFSSKIAPRDGVVEHGHALPAGTRLMWMKTAVGRNEDVFADPDRFDPYRYARQGESIDQALPFGAGPRHCIGRGLAEAQCGMFLTAILRAVEILPVAETEVSFVATVSVTPSTVPVRLVAVQPGSTTRHDGHALPAAGSPVSPHASRPSSLAASHR